MAKDKPQVGCIKSQAGIEKLAKRRLAAAKCLVENEYYDDAFYLAGYGIELYLKAVICKTLGVDNFYSFENLKKKEIARAFKSHDYNDLFLLSGIQSEFDSAKIEEPGFKENWEVVNVWNESTRYECDQNPDKVKKFVNASQIICSWIQKHL
jgi:hypothetical protein